MAVPPRSMPGQAPPPPSTSPGASPPPEEREAPAEPIEIHWFSPIFLTAYALIGLLCVWGLYRMLFGSARNPNLVRVRGTVTLQGKPLAGAVVTFHPVAKDGVAAVGATDRFGKFDLRTPGQGSGALVGEYRVTVTKMASEEKMMTPDEAKQYLSKTGKPPPEPKVSNLAPPQYASPQTTPLMVTVKRGGGQFKLDLK